MIQLYFTDGKLKIRQETKTGGGTALVGKIDAIGQIHFTEEGARRLGVYCLDKMAPDDLWRMLSYTYQRIENPPPEEPTELF
jgi:hypothetical protein